SRALTLRSSGRKFPNLSSSWSISITWRAGCNKRRWATPAFGWPDEKVRDPTGAAHIRRPSSSGGLRIGGSFHPRLVGRPHDRGDDVLYQRDQPAGHGVSWLATGLRD